MIVVQQHGWPSPVCARAEALLVAGVVAQPGEHHVERKLAHGGRLHVQQAQRGLLQQQRRAQVLLLQGAAEGSRASGYALMAMRGRLFAKASCGCQNAAFGTAA